MTRRQRKATARLTRKQALAWPLELTAIPASQWPTPPPGDRVTGIWRSRHYLAVSYAAPAVNGIECRRLTINRVTIGGDGRWDADIPWDELQRCKRETGYGGWYGIEVYPRDRDIVNVAAMRHLWLLAEPLPIGWFASVAAPPATLTALGALSRGAG